MTLEIPSSLVLLYEPSQYYCCCSDGDFFVYMSKILAEILPCTAARVLHLECRPTLRIAVGYSTKVTC